MRVPLAAALRRRLCGDNDDDDDDDDHDDDTSVHSAHAAVVAVAYRGSARTVCVATATGVVAEVG
jgi:hypothetical protein